MADRALREEHTDDQDAVRAVHLAAFGDHGAAVADLVDDLRETDGALSIVAQVDGGVVGHVMFTGALLDAPRRLVAVQTLSPLGVLPAHQRRGTGAALVHHGLALLAERGVPLVFLEGSPDYYQRLGFKSGGPLGFRKPSLRIPDAGFQVAVLPSYQPWHTGTFVYPDVFWRHDLVGLRDPDA
jgi:putative acetyltransferase